MTVLEATTRILASWLRREDEIRTRLLSIRDEQLALTALLRTVETQRVAAQMAVAAAKEVPGANGVAMRRVPGVGVPDRAPDGGGV